MLKIGLIWDFRASSFPQKRPKNENETNSISIYLSKTPIEAIKLYRISTIPLGSTKDLPENAKNWEIWHFMDRHLLTLIKNPKIRNSINFTDISVERSIPI